MKIAINGTIIDTKDIYQITSIEEQSMDPGLLNFRILFFNNKDLYISLDSNLFLENSRLRSYNNYRVIIKNNASLQDLRNHPDYIQCKSKLNEFRDRIVKVWSENQSPIPQFNLEP